MMKATYDVIVIGAGHAGLSISYFLARHKVDHIVLEEGKVGQTWRTQRWNTFQMVTPNKANMLPGQQQSDNPNRFSSAQVFTNELEMYCRNNNLPIRCNCKVISVTKLKDEFLITTGRDSKLYCKQVVIASGSQNRPVIPSFSKSISSHIHQIHSSQYKDAVSLPEGTVLVVGSSQSGFQISQDLISAGRNVFLSTSRVGKIPRIYRGLDIVDWLIRIGFYDLSVFMEDDGVNEPITTQPQVFGGSKPDESDSYYWLHKLGVQLIGDLEESKDSKGYIVNIKPTLQSNILFAKNYSERITNLIDKYIEDHDLKNDIQEKENVFSSTSLEVAETDKFDLFQNKIKTIIWATGFKGDFSFIKLPVFENGKLKHNEGVSNIAGLYYIGLPWMRKRKSGIIWGVRDDAEYISQKILDNR